AGVADERGHVGGDEHLLVAQAEHHGAAVAGRHYDVRMAGVEDHDAVGADHRGQRLADRLFQVVGAAGRDQVGEHLAVGLGGEHGPVHGQLGPQLVGVLDYPVVHDRDGPADVRVRVDVTRLAVGGPPGVADAR